MWPWSIVNLSKRLMPVWPLLTYLSVVTFQTLPDWVIVVWPHSIGFVISVAQAGSAVPNVRAAAAAKSAARGA